MYFLVKSKYVTTIIIYLKVFLTLSIFLQKKMVCLALKEIVQCFQKVFLMECVSKRIMHQREPVIVKEKTAMEETWMLPPKLQKQLHLINRSVIDVLQEKTALKIQIMEKVLNVMLQQIQGVTRLLLVITFLNKYSLKKEQNLIFYFIF